MLNFDRSEVLLFNIECDQSATLTFNYPTLHFSFLFSFEKWIILKPLSSPHPQYFYGSLGSSFLVLGLCLDEMGTSHWWVRKMSVNCLRFALAPPHYKTMGSNEKRKYLPFPHTGLLWTQICVGVKTQMCVPQDSQMNTPHWTVEVCNLQLLTRNGLWLAHGNSWKGG